MKRKTRMGKLKRRIGGVVYEAPLEARWFNFAGRYAVPHKAMKAGELNIAAQIAAEGSISAEGFNWMRRVLGYTGIELGELLGVRFETISRWERKAVKVDRLAWLLLASLVLEEAGEPMNLMSRVRASLPSTAGSKQRGRTHRRAA